MKIPIFIYGSSTVYLILWTGNGVCFQSILLFEDFALIPFALFGRSDAFKPPYSEISQSTDTIMTTTTSWSCDLGWIQSDSKCYKASTGGLNFDAAYYQCTTTYGAGPFIPQSDAEDNAALGYLEDGEMLWLGIFSGPSGGQWVKRTDGSPATYFYWDGAAPLPASSFICLIHILEALGRPATASPNCGIRETSREQTSMKTSRGCQLPSSTP
jgi:hypothetical protein